MDFKIIVSISEALLASPEKLKNLDSYGNCIYRINGAHIDIKDMASLAKVLRAILKKPEIMLDLPGNKIRTQGLTDPIILAKGEMFELHAHHLNYPGFYSYLKAGDMMLANESTTILEVKEVQKSFIRILSHSDGLLHNNRGLHVQGVHHEIPFLFEKDIDLIGASCAEDLDYISISFTRTAEDIREVKKILASNGHTRTRIFAKVETAAAVKNLKSILDEVDHINIDRGDLSADIGILNLPAVQEHVIRTAREAGKNVYLATHFLKHMEHNPLPLIAEIVDLYKTIKAGISGIQLSEETAIGKYPVECVRLVFDIYRRSSQPEDLVTDTAGIRNYI